MTSNTPHPNQRSLNNTLLGSTWHQDTIEGRETVKRDYSFHSGDSQCLRPCKSLTLHQHPPRQASMNSSTCDGAGCDQSTPGRGRRRQGNPENWAFNIAKRKRNEVEKNVDKKGKQVKPRVMEYRCV
ncbi:hypothetical protein PoB_005430400 [Plakobranchus ocellatus]|uniref:Uncharacterized protein n=1 Tax=Plakobranchus ocellatus TaxID=259542 RepID=A0AAV4C5G5_9GAST|nr:hypothetical protein PoB_005430400 [Plakobranchus ocellatus]